jgi:hypothetical protein
MKVGPLGFADHLLVSAKFHLPSLSFHRFRKLTFWGLSPETFLIDERVISGHDLRSS